jgi:hypothetical protein
LPERGDQPAQLVFGRGALVGQHVAAVEGAQDRGDRELGVERALALDLGRMRRQHRRDPDRRESIGRRPPPHPGGFGLGEEAPQRGCERGTSFPARGALAADVMAVLGDVGQQREVAESAHDQHREVVGQGVECLGERLARGHVLEAAAGHGETANGLDLVESELALVGADRIAQEAPEEANVFREGRVLVRGSVHPGSFPRSAR